MYMSRSLLFGSKRNQVSYYPLISVILTADCSLPITEQCLCSFSDLQYPKDKLEFLLILPPQHPYPRSLDSTPRLKMIQFDAALGWSEENAKLEGFSLARGEYTQFLDASLTIKPLWLANALEFCVDFHPIGVRGEIDHNGASHLNQQDQFNGSNGRRILDGLYNRNELTKYLANGNTTYFESPQDSDKVMTISEPMAVSLRYGTNGMSLGRYVFDRIGRMTTKRKFASNHS